MTSCRRLLPSGRYRRNRARQSPSACWLRSSRRCRTHDPRPSPRWSHDEGSPLVLLRRNEIGGRKRQHRPAEGDVHEIRLRHSWPEGRQRMNLGPRGMHLSAGNQSPAASEFRWIGSLSPPTEARRRPTAGDGPDRACSHRAEIHTDRRLRLALTGRPSAAGQIGADACPHRLLREPRSATARFRRTSPRGTPRCPRSPPHARSQSV
jgi:hypothetical protein